MAKVILNNNNLKYKQNISGKFYLNKKGGTIDCIFCVARVYDWFDSLIEIPGEIVVENNEARFNVENELEKGLYIFLGVYTVEGKAIVGNRKDNLNFLEAFTVEGNIKKTPTELYNLVVNIREQSFNRAKGEHSEQRTSKYHVYIFAKFIKLGTRAQYDDIEIYPFDYLKMESEVNYINRFFDTYKDVSINVKGDRFESSVPAAVFCIRNIYAESYEKAEKYALAKADILNNIFTALLRSHGTFFATVVLNENEKMSKISMLDSRYKGNLLLLAEQGFNIRHYYKVIANKNSYIRVYLKLLNEAMKEHDRMLSYYRYWNILEGISSKKDFVNKEMRTWEGTIVKNKKGEICKIGDNALNNVFELFRVNFSSVSSTDFVNDLEKITRPKEFISVCYQRRNCCAHHGDCNMTDKKRCSLNKDMVRCKNNNIIHEDEPLGFQDKILRKLQDSTFQIILNEIHSQCGTVDKETKIICQLLK